MRIVNALLMAYAIVSPAHADLVHSITESQLWQDYSEPVFEYLTDDLPGVSVTREILETWSDLNASDAQWAPNFSGGPQVPSSCLEQGDEACIGCFTQSYEKLNFVRATLERLRAIYGATTLYTQRMIAHGDSLAPSTGVAAIEWSRQRVGIERSVDELKNTYQKKYDGLLGTLDSALRQIGKCEADNFNERDWYERYGFLYYTFIQDRYRLQN